MLFSNFDYIGGELTRDGSMIFELFMALVVGLFTIIPTIYFIHSFIKFKKIEGVKFLNKPWFLMFCLSQFFAIFTIGLGWMFFYGEFILGTGAEAGRTGFIIVLTSIIISYTCIVIYCLILLFFSKNVWILIETNTKTILTIRESIKIRKIVYNEEKRKVYISCAKRDWNGWGEATGLVLKQISFSTETTVGSFILENIDKLETEHSFEEVWV